jgi:hypothetical protein
MNETNATYAVPAWNLEKLQTAIAKLNGKVKRAQKRNLLIEAVVIEVGPAYPKDIIEVVNGENVTKSVPFHDVTLVSPKPPKAEGWEFIAALTHIDGVGAVLRNVPGAEVAEGALAKYRTASSINCDHCEVRNSRRTETFIVREVATQNLRQVGRNCLQSYTGLKNPEWLCQAAEYLMAAEDILGQAEDTEFGGGHGSRGYDSIEAFMPFVVASVRLQGWLSRGKAYAMGGQSTCDHALSHGMYPSMNDKYIFFPEQADKEEAERCLSFIEEKFSAEGFEPSSDYESNLRVAMLGGMLMPKLAGIIASAYPYYLREMERVLKQQTWAKVASTSQHIGAEGERVLFRDAQVMSYRAIQKESYGYGDGGVTHLYTFLVNGSVVKWFSSNDLGVALGDIVSFKATVKRHSEWKGIKETQVNRAVRVLKATITEGPVVENVVTGWESVVENGVVVGNKEVRKDVQAWKLDDNAGHSNLALHLAKATKKLVASLTVGAEVEVTASWHLQVLGDVTNYVSVYKD